VTFRLAVVTAGVGVPSSSRLLADKLAQAARTQLAVAGDEVDVTVIELRELAHDIVNHTLTGFPGPELDRALKDVAAADGLIVVTPIFNASYSGLFKSFFDLFEPDDLAGMPVLVAATGGTERHSLALEHAVRPLFTYLRAVVVPTSVYAASSDFGAGTESGATLVDRIERAAAELVRLARQAEPRAQRDPYTDITPFEQLLAAD